MSRVNQIKSDFQENSDLSQNSESKNIAVSSNKSPQENSEITPMMKQFLEIKEEYNEYLLFYRMGDFYELFFEDAEIAAKELDIVLTRRGKQAGEDIPMCGVPHHSYESYLKRLIKKGFKVAICEQTETPEEAKKRAGYKAVVKREVVRVVTPATLTEDNLLEDKLQNYLCSLIYNQKQNLFAISWSDISTGELEVASVKAEDIISEVERINPKEIIIFDSLLSEKTMRSFVNEYKDILTSFPDKNFKGKKSQNKICDFFEVKSLDGMPSLNSEEISAISAIIEYINITQIDNKPKLQFPRKNQNNDFLEIDGTTMRSLEIFQTQKGERKNTLFDLLNQCKIAGGSRLLYSTLAKPMINDQEIEEYYEAIEFFINNSDFLKELRYSLSKIADLERILSRIYINRSNPKDLAAVRDSLEEILNIASNFTFIEKITPPKLIEKCTKELSGFDDLYLLLKEAIEEFPAINLNEGRYIKDGFHPKLDDYRNAKSKSEEKKKKLTEEYIKLSGINNLKIKNNNVIGTFIEINPSQAEKCPEFFIHRQTLASSVRYTTEELRKIENELINSHSFALSLEIEIYHKIRNEIINKAGKIRDIYSAVSKIDLIANYAYISILNEYNKPKINKGKILNIHDGRHPVVEKINRLDSSEKVDFTPNDIKLSSEVFNWLVTGPNMSGKSTYLRQNAIIIIMAQIGCFIPAKNAEIGITDKIFSRVGASDNIAKGQSTFMVEMSETASILNNATERSFVILDEIGRGTATFDGLSIAWATLEHLHDNIKCRCLFASHYHELTSLESNLKNLACYQTEIKEWNEEIIFMHKIVPGKAENSYGIFVGKIAGIPNNVIERASEILKILEEENKNNSSQVLSSDLPLFKESNNGEKYKTESVKTDSSGADITQKNSDFTHVIDKIENLNINDMTPLECLNFLSEVKKSLKTQIDQQKQQNS